MITKAFEIRDAGTFIAVIATLMESGDHQEHYLLRRSGYGLGRCVMLCRMDANGTGYQASYDAYGWGMARTMGTAHGHISEHWDKLQSGQVIDVQFILGETTKPKVSESVNYGFAVEGEQYP